MDMRRRGFLGCSAASGLLALAGRPAAAQDWPSRPIRLIVTFPPGGASDIVARLVAPGLSERLGQSVVVDNRPGGGTTIGANAMLAAKDDFHTLMISNSAPISIAPFLFEKRPYDPDKDFTHVAYVGSVANAFAVHASVPANTLKELVDWIRAQDKPVPFGSGGGGSIGHIVGEMFKAEFGLQMEHIAYRGSAPMFQDMLGGQLLFAVNTLPEVWALAKDGRLKVLALTSTQRPSIAPAIPLVGELGLPKLVAENFVGISAQAGMPPASVARLHKAAADTLAEPKVAARLEDMGFVTAKLSPAEFAAFVRKQIADFGPAVRTSGARLD